MWKLFSVRSTARKLFRLAFTIQKNFLIWISRSFKKGASDNTISFFDQSFWFSGLTYFGQRFGEIWSKKVVEIRERTNIFFLNFEQWMMQVNFFSHQNIEGHCNFTLDNYKLKRFCAFALTTCRVDFLWCRNTKVLYIYLLLALAKLKLGPS